MFLESLFQPGGLGATKNQFRNKLINKRNNIGYIIGEFALTMYHTPENVFHQEIQTLRHLLKTAPKSRFFGKQPGVWISCETRFLVYEKAFKTNQYFKRKSNRKLA